MRHLIVTKQLLAIFIGIILLSFTAVPSTAAELDDSNLFIEAFNAYQKKDYLLAMEKVEKLTQVFPDSPLRDISLLLLARSSLKSGNNETAAKAINRFNSEYTENSLKTTVEEELLSLGARQKKGEKLAPNLKLQATAQKVRNDALAMERAVAMKAEQERLAREKSEREKVAWEKAEVARKERERLAAEKAAKDAIKLAVFLPGDNHQGEVGKKVIIPFELSNKGIGREEFLLSITAPQEYTVALTSATRTDEQLDRVTLASGETLKGNLIIQTPFGKVDGYKSRVQVTATSAKFNDVSFTKDTMVTAMAPLVRTVARPQKSKVTAGEAFKYRITVLNAGSIAANNLTVKAEMPADIDLVDVDSSNYRQEAGGVVTMMLPSLEVGKLEEFTLNVKVKNNVPEKQELRLQVEVANVPMQIKVNTISTPAVVQGK